MTDEISKYDSVMESFKGMLQNQKDANLKKSLQAFVLPLIEALREETIDAFDIVSERIEDIEEDAVSAKADKLITDALPVMESLYNVINVLMNKHGHIVGGDYSVDVDADLKNLHLSSQNAMVAWFQQYKNYQEATEDDDDGEDDEEEVEAEDKAA